MKICKKWGTNNSKIWSFTKDYFRHIVIFSMSRAFFTFFMGRLPPSYSMLVAKPFPRVLQNFSLWSYWYMIKYTSSRNYEFLFYNLNHKNDMTFDNTRLMANLSPFTIEITTVEFQAVSHKWKTWHKLAFHAWFSS